MASDSKSGWDRLREREEEEEQERAEQRERELLKSRLEHTAKGAASDLSGETLRDASAYQESGSTEKLAELLERVDPLMEQVHLLYGQFFSGVERLPPIERRKQLDQVVNMLSSMSKPTQVLQFRFKTVQARYRTYCEQWDRKLRELENGRLVRRIRTG